MGRGRDYVWALFAVIMLGSAGGARAAPAGEPYWGLLSRVNWPERERIREPYRFKRVFGYTDVRGMDYFYHGDGGRPQIVGFRLKNDGSRRINPAGLGGREAFREYCFLYPDRARENVHLIVTDDVAVSGRYSQDNMFREWHFFPRRFLPAIEVSKADNRARVTLPTGEPVEFALDSKEIVGGVLREAPLDMTRSRHARKNPRVRYTGEYLALTVAQRGESARRARVWGRRKTARVHYPARYPDPCEISPARLWDQTPEPGDSDPRLTTLYRSDAELFDLLERHCGWDLGELRRPPEMPTRLVERPVRPAPGPVELSAADRQALVQRILNGETTVREAAGRYGRSAEEVDRWVQATLARAEPAVESGGMFEH